MLGHVDNPLNTLDNLADGTRMKNEDWPFHVIHTNGTFFGGYVGDVMATYVAKKLNQHALDNGLADRYLAIPKPDTPQEES